MKSWQVFLSILCAIIFITLCARLSSSPPDLHSEYTTWCHMFHYYPTYEQWLSMKENDLLPTVPQPMPLAR